jgi:signal-transduction protein with cAMP-binding, CBS, and nucleotidyltransferase domain
VADAMQAFERVSPTASLAEAAHLMRSHHGRALIVDTGEESPSIFTEYDIVKVVAAGLPVEGETVGDHVTHVAIAATPDWSLARAVDTMMQGQFRHLVVMENGETVGMVAMRDIVEVMMRAVQTLESEAASADTIELGSHVDEEAQHLLHNLRRSAKQHMAALKCPCELEWIEILIGQAEERPELTREELQSLWDVRQPCPALHAEGGGAD